MDYKKIGFMCGLEIHQELSGKKLFCSCLTDMKEEGLELEIKRKLRATAGEIGETDVAAEFEQLRDRNFIYHGYKNEYCLVDADCEPPHEINKEALNIALTICKVLKLNIPDSLVVMRKIITDGSACSSFQRTILCGLESNESFIKTSKGEVKITSLCLEEDACKIEKTDGKDVYYSLSRQGIPLIEIRTDPDVKDAEHAKETAEKIGLILRSFPIKRGIGTIRQDVNLSVKNGVRVEVKGFQDLRSMPKVIESEVKRQLDLIDKSELKAEVRKANADGTTSFLRPLPGASRMYPDTDFYEILITKEQLEALKLPELTTEKIVRLEKEYNLSSQLAREIIKRNINLERYVKSYNKVRPDLIGYILIEIPKEIKRRYNLDIKKIKDKDYDLVLSLLDKGEIEKGAVIEILVEVAQGKKVDISKYKRADLNELEKEVRLVVEKNKGLSINALMGIIMKDYKGKIDGKEVMKILKKLM